MYLAITLFWVSGILFTYGFNQKTFEDLDIKKYDRLLFALSFRLWFLWPFVLGNTIRRRLDKNNQ